MERNKLKKILLISMIALLGLLICLQLPALFLSGKSEPILIKRDNWSVVAGSSKKISFRANIRNNDWIGLRYPSVFLSTGYVHFELTTNPTPDEIKKALLSRDQRKITSSLFYLYLNPDKTAIPQLKEAAQGDTEGNTPNRISIGKLLMKWGDPMGEKILQQEAESPLLLKAALARDAMESYCYAYAEGIFILEAHDGNDRDSDQRILKERNITDKDISKYEEAFFSSDKEKIKEAGYILAMARVTSDRVENMMISYLKDENYRGVALNYFLKNPNSKAIPYLCNIMLHDERYYSRFLAACVLGKTEDKGKKSLKPLIQTAKDMKDPLLSNTAFYILKTKWDIDRTKVSLKT